MKNKSNIKVNVANVGISAIDPNKYLTITKEDFLRTYGDAGQRFIDTLEARVRREAIRAELKRCIKDISKYQVSAGFGSASGSIGMSSVVSYLKKRLEEQND